MSDQQLRMEREQAMHLLRSGLSVSEISQSMGRSPVWVYKWKKRYEAQGWAGLVSQSREPNHARHEYDEEMRRLICQTRSELEAEAASGIGLCYIGATTIQARLRERLKPSPSLPSMATINRVLNEAGMTRAKEEALVKIAYPTLCPTQPHQVYQVDIVPHHLPVSTPGTR